MNLVRLARPLKLVCRETEITFPTNFVLAAPSPMVGKLFLFPNSVEHRTESEPDEWTFSDFEAFHGREGRFVSEVEIPENWTEIDTVEEIVYLSRKYHGGGDGRPNRFRHRFAPKTTLYRSKGDWLCIEGRGLYVCDRGIVN